jgi:DNA topoisomerase-1
VNGAKFAIGIRVKKISAHKVCEKSNKSHRRFSARAGLHYVNDDDLRITRAHSGKGFQYLSSGRVIRDRCLISRIDRLAIPPGWKNVRICRDPHGHIQAVGKDVKGRKQYRYHDRWSELRNENKFDRMRRFGELLPRIRHAVARDLRRPQLTREKVLAAVVQLLELSAARIGNEQYVSENKSYGLSTLRNRHARVNGATIHLKFHGKTGKEHELDVRHPTVAKIVRKCQHLPGQKLFEFEDDAGVHGIGSEDVNAYLSEISGESITTKDFRTWKATVLAAQALNHTRRGDPKLKNKNIKLAITQVARQLGNTPAICKKCYIHPSVAETYLADSLPAFKEQSAAGRRSRLRPEEQAVLRLLRRERKIPSPA